MFLCADLHSLRCPAGHRYPRSSVGYFSDSIALRCTARRPNDRRRHCGLITLFVARRIGDYLGIKLSYTEMREIQARGGAGAPGVLLDVLFAREPKEREIFLGFLQE